MTTKESGVNPTRRSLLKLGSIGVIAASANASLGSTLASAADSLPESARSGPIGYTSFINPTTQITTSTFSIGAQSLIEGYVSLQGASARLGHASDLQDNCRLLNFGDIPASLTIGDGSFTAHGVTFIGNVNVGSGCGTVINAVVQNATIGDASITGFTAQILGNNPHEPIQIPEATLVLFGACITQQSDVAANTMPIPAAFSLFSSDADQENILLARGYNLLYRASARMTPFSSVLDDPRNPGASFPDVETAFGKLSIGPPTVDRRGNGVIPTRQVTLSDTSFQIFQPLATVPTPLTPPPDQGGTNAPPSDSPDSGARFIAPRVASPELIHGAIVLGGVALAENVTVGPGSYLHGGDTPAVSIGANTRIGQNTSIHELTFSSVGIGSGVVIGDRVVLHGPLVIGNNVSVGDGTVLFGPTVADNVKIGARVLVFGPVEISQDVPDDSILVPRGLEGLIAPSHRGPRPIGKRSSLMEDQWTVAAEAGSCRCCSGILLRCVSRSRAD